MVHKLMNLSWMSQTIHQIKLAFWVKLQVAGPKGKETPGCCFWKGGWNLQLERVSAIEFTFWGSDFMGSFTWLLMNFVVNKRRKFGHLFSSTYSIVIVWTGSRYFKFVLISIFSFPFAIWNSKSLGWKMSKLKNKSDFYAMSMAELQERGVFSPQHLKWF